MDSLAATPVASVGPVACFGPESVPLPVAQMSTEQYLHMIESGVLEAGSHVELIDGVVVPMSPVGPEHHACTIALVELFAPVLNRYRISVQGTLRVRQGDVYDPDFMLLRRKAEGYRGAHASCDDVALVIEASASSLRRDREVKMPAYAEAGLVEFWIADLERDALIIHRDPRDRAYQTVTEHSGNDLVTPLACPELPIRVGDIFA